MHRAVSHFTRRIRRQPDRNHPRKVYQHVNVTKACQTKPRKLSNGSNKIRVRGAGVCSDHCRIRRTFLAFGVATSRTCIAWDDFREPVVIRGTSCLNARLPCFPPLNPTPFSPLLLRNWTTTFSKPAIFLFLTLVQLLRRARQNALGGVSE